MDSEVELGDMVDMMCSTEYSGHEAPRLTWSGYGLGGRQVINETDDKTARSVWFWLTNSVS